MDGEKARVESTPTTCEHSASGVPSGFLKYPFFESLTQNHCFFCVKAAQLTLFCKSYQSYPTYTCLPLEKDQRRLIDLYFFGLVLSSIFLPLLLLQTEVVSVMLMAPAGIDGTEEAELSRSVCLAENIWKVVLKGSLLSLSRRFPFVVSKGSLFPLVGLALRGTSLRGSVGLQGSKSNVKHQTKPVESVKDGIHCGYTGFTWFYYLHLYLVSNFCVTNLITKSHKENI